MSRSDRGSKHATQYRRWSLAFTFLLFMFSGHLTFASISTGANASTTDVSVLVTTDGASDHDIECSSDSPLVLSDRVRLGSSILNSPVISPSLLSSFALTAVQPAIQGAPLDSAVRRALLQIFLI